MDWSEVGREFFALSPPRKSGAFATCWKPAPLPGAGSGLLNGGVPARILRQRSGLPNRAALVNNLGGWRFLPPSPGPFTRYEARSLSRSLSGSFPGRLRRRPRRPCSTGAASSPAGACAPPPIPSPRPEGRHNACGGYLSSGEVHSAAADWSRYPVGTRFKIVETGELCQIDDYGSALVGTNTIDLYKNSRGKMNTWGVRIVHIQILQWGSARKSLEILAPRCRNSHVRPHGGRAAKTDPGCAAQIPQSLLTRSIMKLLVTGGAGYIGSICVEQLLEQGHRSLFSTISPKATARRWIRARN